MALTQPIICGACGSGMYQGELTTAEMNALSSPQDGWTCYNTDWKLKATYNGTYSIWVNNQALPFTNKSGGALVAGDVVVSDGANGFSVTTTASAGNEEVQGPIITGGADNASVLVAKSGTWDVLIEDQDVSLNYYIQCSNVAKIAEVTFTSGTGNPQDGAFAKANEAKSSGAGITLVSCKIGLTGEIF